VTEYVCAFSNEEAQDTSSAEVEETPSVGLPETGAPTNPASEVSDVESLIPENTLPLEEATENLEIPHLEGDTTKHISDSFYFYQGREV
jgi:hypothetical protein